jgi:hypothetical protein
MSSVEFDRELRSSVLVWWTSAGTGRRKFMSERRQYNGVSEIVMNKKKQDIYIVSSC